MRVLDDIVAGVDEPGIDEREAGDRHAEHRERRPGRAFRAGEDRGRGEAWAPRAAHEAASSGVRGAAT
jgi:hypothetical protein